ncbi:hypothetical protein [Pseudomonas folii]|uniref:ApeA N-terminal domain-containing protein n=1 Tax=Pseudomonas folii TaxID=2762593 RepID=A0ABR7AX39_9PSED|nr:hypothetical protein [Pseudomonas folii]MBC3948955.1 hypothetical protein [Pseudomonas folii]
MIERYVYLESIFSKEDEISAGLSLNKNNSPALRIFRLLTGTCNISDVFFDKKFKLSTNYLNFPYTQNARPNKSSLLGVFPDDVSLLDISTYFRSLRSNDEFYEIIEFELINCIVARKSERYLEAFLFLYRVLEGISYSIPLIYVSKSKSFNKSFKSLQKYMPTKNNEGELLFFKNFIKSEWKDEYFFRLTLDIDVGSIEVEEMRSVYFNLYKEKAKTGLQSETEDEELKISFIGFMEFMIELRNRYFHYLQGGWQKNISTSQIIFPDLFFKPIIDLGVNWVSIALFEVIKFDIDNHAGG